MFIRSQFKRSILYKSNHQNLQIIKKNKEHQEDNQRIENIEKLHKWDKFRQARQVVVDEYIRLKRKQMRALGFLHQILKYKIIMKLKENYEMAQYLHEVQLKSAFMCLKIAHLWKRRCKRWGMKRKVVYYSRRAFKLNTINAILITDTLQERGKKIITEFFAEQRLSIAFKSKVAIFSKQVCYIQKKVRDQHMTKYQKVEVLLNYWDKLTGEI